MASSTDLNIKGFVFTLDEIDAAFKSAKLGVPEWEGLKAFVVGAKAMYERMNRDGNRDTGRTEQDREDNPRSADVG